MIQRKRSLIKPDQLANSPSGKMQNIHLEKTPIKNTTEDFSSRHYL
jgi:hypothetical protein